MENEFEIFKYFFIVMLFLVPFALYGIFLIDKLIRTLHDSYPSEWERAGSPSGIFHNPPDFSNIGSALSMLKNGAAWVFVTPEWVKGDEILSSDLLKYRICVLVWNIGVLLLVIVVFMSLKETIFQLF